MLPCALLCFFLSLSRSRILLDRLSVVISSFQDPASWSNGSFSFLQGSSEMSEITLTQNWASSWTLYAHQSRASALNQ